MALSAGTRLGPYEILAPLGAGGMGEVYRARDTRLGRDVAVKVLPDNVAADARALARFESEARAVAALSHPNILALFDVGREGSVFFVVTELLDGETLREALGNGPLQLKKALDVGLQVADGLAAAHGKGIVHRDVKPENVFLTKDGHVKLLDFGLARREVSSRDPSDTRSPTLGPVSETGVLLGTVAYMSPEQARGVTVDFRSDQFSLGVVLYEILTGKRPFEGVSAAESLAATIRDEPEQLTEVDPTLPALLGWIVQRCLSKDPEERYSSTRDLAKELENLRAHLPAAISAKDVVPGKTVPLGRRVPFRALAAVGVASVALALLFAIRFVQRGTPPAPALSLSLSFSVEASPDIFNTNPLALTPDGKTLVYVGMRDNTSPMLFIRRLDRDEIRAIPGTDGAALPFLSPDGLEVGFFAEGKLKKVALDGGLPITLCDARIPRGGSWGADGTIVFTPSAMSGLQRISSSGGEPRPVTNPDAAKGEKHLFPQILPDGEHVLFDLSDNERTGGAAVVSLRTGVRKVVFEDAPYPRYLPTGHLAFTRPGSLHAVPFDLTNLEASGPPVPVLTDLMTNLNFLRTAEYAFSRDGTLVYVPTRQLQRTFVWVDRKGAVERIPFPPGGYEEVVLSPDGERLATRVIEKSEKMTLLFGDLARGTLTRSTAEGSFQCLVWAPDGKRVAFGFKPAGARGFFSTFYQAVDGSVPPERLTHESRLQTALPTSFSPDGSMALIQVIDYADTTPANTRWDIFALPLGSTHMRPFLKTRAKEELARFSPDGRWVAYRSDESGQLEIFVQRFPGPGPKWQVSTEGGSEPRWSRSGRELFYRQDDKVNRQNDKMMVVDVETAPTFRAGRPRVLFEGQFYDFGINCYDASPDASRFIMIKEDPAELGPAHVNVVLNWFDEVKRRVPGAK